ncbi:MAG: hypothetical protein LC808_38025 [Actinobacteria bacterium]|nr:hypothetical protein [Actinomycetota bacterium]
MPDMEQVMRAYHERTRAESAAARQKLIEVCKTHGVPNIEIEFDGCGDEGSTNMLTSHDPEVETAATDVAYFLLEEHYPGWEINDGSSGTILVDLATGKLEIEFGSRFTDVEWSHKEVSL